MHCSRRSGADRRPASYGSAEARLDVRDDCGRLWPTNGLDVHGAGGQQVVDAPLEVPRGDMRIEVRARASGIRACVPVARQRLVRVIARTTAAREGRGEIAASMEPLKWLSADATASKASRNTSKSRPSACPPDEVLRHFGEGVTECLSGWSKALFAQMGEQDSA